MSFTPSLTGLVTTKRQKEANLGKRRKRAKKGGKMWAMRSNSQQRRNDVVGHGLFGGRNETKSTQKGGTSAGHTGPTTNQADRSARQSGSNQYHPCCWLGARARRHCREVALALSPGQWTPWLRCTCPTSANHRPLYMQVSPALPVSVRCGGAYA